MSLYIDTSVLAALFTIDALTDAADSFLRRHQPTILVSDFVGAELASAVAHRRGVG